jgi:hypothetical protein
MWCYHIFFIYAPSLSSPVDARPQGRTYAHAEIARDGGCSRRACLSQRDRPRNREGERGRARGEVKGGDVCAGFELICGSVNHFTESKVRVHRRQLSTTLPRARRMEPIIGRMSQRLVDGGLPRHPQHHQVATTVTCDTFFRHFDM